MNIKKTFWFSLILVLFVGGCQLSLPPNVEIVVSEDYINYWRLSPNGDYLAYGSPRGKGNFLLDLATGKEHEFDCGLHWWDNYLIGCYASPELFVIDVKTLTKTPLTLIDLTKQSKMSNPEYANEAFIEQLLINSEKIYYPEWVTHTVYILAPDYQLNPDENYIIWGLKQPDELLAQYTVINILDDSPASRSHEEAHSPDGLYYYKAFTVDLTIYRANTDEKVIEFFTEKAYIDVLGWAADSSGVYFIENNIAFIGHGMPEAIYKLKIPSE